MEWIPPSALAAALVLAGWLHYKAARGNFSATLAAPSEPVQSKLRIHSAFYGAPDVGGDDNDVAEALRAMAVEGSLALDVENHSFWVSGRNLVPTDPKKDAKKRLAVKYSYGNREVIAIERPEGTRLVLPEDTFLVGELARLTELARISPLAADRVCQENLFLKTKLDGLEQENESIKKQLEPYRKAEAERTRATEILKDAPGFHVSYIKDSGNTPESLILRHISGKPAVNISIGDLASTNRHRITTSPSRLFLSAVGQDEKECRLEVEHGVRKGQIALPDVLREGTPQSLDIVIVDYEDEHGNHFQRDFALTREFDDGVTWMPGKIRLRDSQVAQKA
jgi:hypothetical protein